MPLAQSASGTQACTISSTHILSTPTAGKTYVLFLDLAAMTATDVLDIIVRAKTLTGSTLASVYTLTLAGVQGDPVFMSIPYPAFHGAEFAIRQTAGTGRSIPWSVISLD